MRADAARNRDRILDAARSLIARDGPDVSMDDIAAAAGVAVGTLYRHHPTKAALVAAVIDQSVARIADLAEAARTRTRAGAAAGEELDALFSAVAAQYAGDAAAKQAAASLGAPHSAGRSGAPARGTPERRAWDAIDEILRAAQRTGEIRPDVGMPDLVALLSGVPATGPVSARDRYVDIVLAGLRAPARARPGTTAGLPPRSARRRTTTR